MASCGSSPHLVVEPRPVPLSNRPRRDGRAGGGGVDSDDEQEAGAKAAGKPPHHGHRERLRERLLRSEEHTSELQSLMRTSYAVFCWTKKINQYIYIPNIHSYLKQIHQ